MAIPESPMVGSAFPSPDLRDSGPSTSRPRVVSSAAPAPRFLLDPTPAAILAQLDHASVNAPAATGKGNDVRAALILRHALRWAVDHADVDLIQWLVGLKQPWGPVMDKVAAETEDDDGWGLVGMMIQASCGRQEAEQGVRLLVGRWGLEIGARGGRDRTGWTPLHLAALISTPPLVSFLLTRGASPHELSNRGLTPYDLISDMPDRQEIAVLLDHSLAASGLPVDNGFSNPSLSLRRRAMLEKRRDKAVERLRRREDDEKRRQATLEKERWVQEMAAIVDVSPQILLPSRRKSADSFMSFAEGDIWLGDDFEDEGIGWDDLQQDVYQSTLVFSLSHLDRIFDILITNYRPHCVPLARRALPANALYLHARFAHYRCDETWLEELIEGAVERVEQGIYGNMEDLAYLGFWAYNCTLLLYLLRADEGLKRACTELELLDMMEELIHAIHVFIIRLAERRIDAVLDVALLEYETLEDFGDIRFEGDWNFFKSIAGRGKKATPVKSVDAFATPSVNEFGGPASPSLFGSLRDNVANGSPFKTYLSHSTTSDFSDAASIRSVSADSSATIPAPPPTDIKPQRVTEVLSAVLMILNLYELNPVIIIQAFSQIFFWISSELFNRILARKKCLCRSKAIQIKMNITVLEDWIRANGLPSRTASQHLEPVNQLLQWLQCSSQIRQFDTLIGTLQSLKALNPLQMRRAVKDYRFEVNEGKMTDECAQYLAQLQKDWEKRRVQLSVEAMQDHQREGSASSVGAAGRTPIDNLFDGTTALIDFVPQSGPDCLGELLDSKFMLPFQLPSNNAYLVATPPTDAAFAHVLPPALANGPRPSSRSSFISARPMGWSLPDDNHLRQMPDDFFRWFKDRKAQLRREQEFTRPKRLVPKHDNPLGPSKRANITPTRRSTRDPLPALVEDENTPVLPASASVPYHPSDPSPTLRSSQSLEALRKSAKMTFDPVPKLNHKRSESFELKPRNSVTSMSAQFVADGSRSAPQQTESQLTNGGPYPSNGSVRSNASNGSTGKKWWNLRGGPEVAEDGSLPRYTGGLGQDAYDADDSGMSDLDDAKAPGNESSAGSQVAKLLGR